MEKSFLNLTIYPYYNVMNILTCLINKNPDKIEKICIGKTHFGYDINCYKIGHGKNNIIIFSATHGNETITVNFALEFMCSLLYDNNLSCLLEEFSFYIIPILNIESYMISCNNVYENTKKLTKIEFENLCKKYLEAYNFDDLQAINENCTFGTKKSYQYILNSSLDNIDNIHIKNSVKQILKNCKLDESILPVFAANGLGFDINSNSIHKFSEMKLLRQKQKCANLRYNNIPVTIPSPMSYPGREVFDKSVIENFILYNFIMKLYKTKNIKYIFSFHSTGGEIYGVPDIKYASLNQMQIHKTASDIYSKITSYTQINEKLKYGIMDFYRIALEGTVSLTIELSKINANPIGPFSNLENLNYEFILNKNAIINVITNKS